MEVMGGSCLVETVAGRHMAASLMEAIVVETVLVAQKTLYLVGAMGWLFNAKGFLDRQGGANQGFDDSITVGLNQKHGRYVGDGFAPDSNQFPPESKEDGDTDDDGEDEEGDEQDGEEEGDDVSGNEDKNQEDENLEDEVEANGDGGSDEEEEEEDDDEDEDEDDDDEEGEEEEEEEDDGEEDEEETPEPPAKKRK